MKKVFALLLSIGLVLSLCGCIESTQISSGSPTNAPAEGTMTVRFINGIGDYVPVGDVSNITEVRVHADSVIKITKDDVTVQEIKKMDVLPFTGQTSTDYGVDIRFDYRLSERGEYMVDFSGVKLELVRTDKIDTCTLVGWTELMVTTLGTEDDTIPETGDETPILLWSLLLFGSAGGFLLLRKRQRA